MTKPKIENNSLLQLVEGEGGFGMFLDGKIYIDDTAKILASVIMRNNGNLNGKIKALTQEQWDMFEKYNLKGEKNNRIIMISKPILKIDKFSGMFDGSQTVYLDGFAVGEQGKSVQETYSTLNVRDNSTYGSQFNKVYGIEYVYPLTGL